MYDWFDFACTKDDECTRKEEHLHVVLAMLVSAIFWLIFVVDAISQENDFELLACIFLTIVMAARAIYFLVNNNHSVTQSVIHCS